MPLCSGTWQHGKYLEDIAKPNMSPVDRLKAVIAFHVSGLVREVFGKRTVGSLLAFVNSH